MADAAGAGKEAYTGQGASDAEAPGARDEAADDEAAGAGVEAAEKEAPGARVEPADDEALGSGRLDDDMDARPCSRLSERKPSVVMTTCTAFQTFNLSVGFNSTSRRAAAVLMVKIGVTVSQRGVQSLKN